MSRYASGRRAEWRARDWFRRRGYTVIRSAGSKGLVDLVAWRAPHVRGAPTDMGRIAPGSSNIPFEVRAPDVVFAQVKYTRTHRAWADENWETLARLKRAHLTPEGVGVCAVVYHHGNTSPEVFWV